MILLTVQMQAFAQKNGEIISETSVTFPAYKDIKGIGAYYNQQDYEQSIQSGFKLKKIIYYSEGLKVVAYYSEPREGVHKKYPVIIFNRGSYIRNDIAFVHAPLFKKLTDSGFVVIAPALRGSEGGEGIDEMGGRDLNDVWNIIPILINHSKADTANMFMYGESRGGVTTFMLLKQKFPVKAAATVGAFTDFAQLVKDNPGMEQLNHSIWKDYDTNKDSIFIQHSAISWASELIAPILLMQGVSDRSVNPRHTLLLAESLLKYKKEFELILLAGGNHVLGGALAKRRDDEIIKWFKKFKH